MKKALIILLSLFISAITFAQSNLDEQLVEKACLDYIEGFYEGDTTKIKNSVKPTLYKFGYWKNKQTGNYEGDGHMTFQQAINYAKEVFEKKNYVSEKAPKKVEILDIINHIASAKITAWWGVDYILLS